MAIGLSHRMSPSVNCIWLIVCWCSLYTMAQDVSSQKHMIQKRSSEILGEQPINNAEDFALKLSERNFMRFGRASEQHQQEQQQQRDTPSTVATCFPLRSIGTPGATAATEIGNENDDRQLEKRFMRFGKRFMRFGRSVRVGEDVSDAAMEAAKRFMRFGKRFMRFGRSSVPVVCVLDLSGAPAEAVDVEKEKAKRFMRFGRATSADTNSGVEQQLEAPWISQVDPAAAGLV